MNKKVIVLVAAILLCAATVVQAQESELGVDLDITWVSKYLWRGYDLFDDVAAFQPSVNIDLYDTGFSINYWASIPAAGGNSSKLGAGRVDAYEYDYTVAYDYTFYDGETYATDVTTNYIYYDFPHAASTYADAQELGVGFAWPDICPEGFIPSYYVGKIWPSKSNPPAASSLGSGRYGGWIHIFGITYDLAVTGFLPEIPEQIISLVADITYNDGFASATAKHDWSHATFGASTNFALGGDLTLTTAVYYQASFEDSVNNEDELYSGMSLSYSF